MSPWLVLLVLPYIRSNDSIVYIPARYRAIETVDGIEVSRTSNKYQTPSATPSL